MIPNQASASAGDGMAGNPAHSRWRLIVGRVALFWGVSGLVVLGAFNLAGFGPREWQGVFGGTVASVGMVGFTWWLLRRDGLRLQNVGLAWSRGSIVRFLLGTGIGFGLFAAMAAIGAVFGGFRWVRSPDMGLVAVAMNAITFLVLGCMEEIGFRGYPLRRLERPLGLWGAQFIVAAMFGFFHYLQGWPWLGAFVGTGLGSLLFGMAAIATRGLAVPIGVHAAGNLLDWSLGGKGGPGLWKLVVVEGTGDRNHLVYTIAYCAVMLAGIAGFWLWHRRQQMPLRSFFLNP